MTTAQADLIDTLVHEAIHQFTGGCAAYVLVVVCPEARCICVRSSSVTEEQAAALLLKALEERADRMRLEEAVVAEVTH